MAIAPWLRPADPIGSFTAGADLALAFQQAKQRKQALEFQQEQRAAQIENAANLLAERRRNDDMLNASRQEANDLRMEISQLQRQTAVEKNETSLKKLNEQIALAQDKLDEVIRNHDRLALAFNQKAAETAHHNAATENAANARNLLTQARDAALNLFRYSPKTTTLNAGTPATPATPASSSFMGLGAEVPATPAIPGTPPSRTTTIVPLAQPPSATTNILNGVKVPSFGPPPQSTTGTNAPTVWKWDGTNAVNPATGEKLLPDDQ